MKYKKGYKYQLTEDEVTQTPIHPAEDIDTHFITLTKTGLLTVRNGYAWDGPSGPTVDTDNSMTPSLNHDAFAQLMRMMLLSRMWRILTNVFFAQQCLKRKMWRARAWFWKNTLDKFGAPSTNPKNAKKEYEVE
tara:strand:+ start:8691 stop:9092 length:402 start_codon:yes stop_codon:yes gene_type:complete